MNFQPWLFKSRFAVLSIWLGVFLGGPLLADWPMGRGNPQGTGATEESLPEQLELLWQLDLDGLGFDGGPIIANGKVFANDHDGRILSLDLETGKEFWRVEMDTGFVATPAFNQGLLFVGDYDGVLHALDAADGKERWSFETGMEITASPNFYGDSVVFTSQDGTLYRLDQQTGELIWKYETQEPILCGASLAGDVTFLGGCDERLHIVDVRDGKPVAEPITIGPTASTPSVMGASVLIPTHAGDIFNFQTKDYAERWRFKDEKLSDEFKNSVAVKDGLVVATGRNKRVFAVEIETGKVRWSQMLRKRSDASPIIAGDSVVIAAADGRIIRFDLQTGEEKWMFEVKGAFLAAPAASDGKLVLANDRGSIFCFGAKKP